MPAVSAVVMLSACAGCRTMAAIWEFFFPPDNKIEDQEAIDYIFEDPKAVPGVVLAIGVTSNGNVVQQTADFRVDQDGNITMPYINSVKVSGLTLQDIREKIAELYADGFYKNPKASVDFHYSPGVGVCPWGTVNVQGQVGKPGPIDLPRTQDLRLTRALQMAGGVTSVGDQDDIRVSFVARDGTITRRSYSLTKIGEGHLNQDIILPPGTAILVPYKNY